MTTGWMKSDVWSLGCTVVEMYNGKVPYAEYENPMTAMYKIASGEIPIIRAHDQSGSPKEIYNELLSFINVCCDVNASARPSAEELLLHAFCSATHSSDQDMFLDDDGAFLGEDFNMRPSTDSSLGDDEIADALGSLEDGDDGSDAASSSSAMDAVVGSSNSLSILDPSSLGAECSEVKDDAVINISEVLTPNMFSNRKALRRPPDSGGSVTSLTYAASSPSVGDPLNDSALSETDSKDEESQISTPKLSNFRSNVGGGGVITGFGAIAGRSRTRGSSMDQHATSAGSTSNPSNLQQQELLQQSSHQIERQQKEQEQQRQPQQDQQQHQQQHQQHQHQQH
jgi:serine/threonine protein kinase